MLKRDRRVIDDAFVAELAAHLRRWGDASKRVIVGIAGIPGSGKSTLGRLLLKAINRDSSGIAVLVPMDGFHLTTQRLEELGLRDHKGAPATFDAEGYCRLLEQARDPTGTVRFPIYDRQVHERVFDDRDDHAISSAVRVIITEGNYLLLDFEPWSALARVLDECWLLDTPIEQARHWTIRRHIRGGRSRDDAETHYERSDALNAKLVRRQMREPDLTLCWPDAGQGDSVSQSKIPSKLQSRNHIPSVWI